MEWAKEIDKYRIYIERASLNYIEVNLLIET